DRGGRRAVGAVPAHDERRRRRVLADLRRRSAPRALLERRRARGQEREHRLVSFARNERSPAARIPPRDADRSRSGGELVRGARSGSCAETDFAEQHASWHEPLRGIYRGVEIIETPPPTQGVTVLEMLNLIEPYEIGKMDPLGPELVHLLVQAKQIAYHDRDRL